MPQIHTLTEAQNLLRPFYNNARTAYTLDTMRALMDYLGNPQNNIRVLHVAGTSGKTSTSYYCAALLQASGKTVGLSVSPHVDTVNERLQVNGLPLSETEFCRVLGEFMDIVAESGIEPSYFELLAALAYWEFERRGLDYVVIEVGLGGMLDGTNVVDSSNKLCVITDIGLDHTEILGDTLPLIAEQKAGIIQPGNAVIMYEQAPEIVAAVTQRAYEQDAVLRIFPADTAIMVKSLPLFQQRNLGLAAAAVDYILQRDTNQALTSQAIDQAANVVVPARLERFRVGDKIVIVDGSHNQQKLHVLLASIAELYPGQEIAALCAFVQGNDERWQGGLCELAQAVNHLIVTGFQSEQDVPKSSVTPNDVATYYRQINNAQPDVRAVPAEAYKVLLERPEPVLLITGSFYLLNHIRPLIKGQS